LSLTPTPTSVDLDPNQSPSTPSHRYQNQDQTLLGETTSPILKLDQYYPIQLDLYYAFYSTIGCALVQSCIFFCLVMSSSKFSNWFCNSNLICPISSNGALHGLIWPLIVVKCCFSLWIPFLLCVFCNIYNIFHYQQNHNGSMLIFDVFIVFF